MKAVLQYRASTGFVRQLAEWASATFTIAVVPESDDAVFAQEMRDADVLLHVLEPVTAQVINAAPRLRLIQKIGVGVNTIDLEAARARGIAVCNMPRTNSQAVAEHTLALMLAALRRLVPLDAATRAGRGWASPPDSFDSVGEIAGRCVGLVGFGEVPQRLVPVLLALGARVVYARLSGTATPAFAPGAVTRRTLDELLAESDIVSLHVPLSAQTEGLLNAERIGRMKPGAVLVNTARGALVDEIALEEALRNGHLRAAGLDVLALEPAAAGHPLFSLDNVVVTPHTAWLTPETLARSLRIAAENCRRLADGEALLHQLV